MRTTTYFIPLCIVLFSLCSGCLTRIDFAFINIEFESLFLQFCRQCQEPAQRNLFQKSKFTAFLIDNFVSLPKNRSQIPPKNSQHIDVKKGAIRGLLVILANAIRLQVAYLFSPTCVFYSRLFYTLFYRNISLF
jgi:hypothetical protein